MARSGLMWIASVSIIGAVGCGMLPISIMSRRGTEVIEDAVKPTPVGADFNGCPAQGESPDFPLNRHKNRIDEGAYLPVTWAMAARLPWPRQVGYRFRNQWSSHESGDVARYEGAAVRVEGYIIDTKIEGPESTNCDRADSSSSDYHIWLAEKPTHKMRRSIVVEITPRVRALHPNWTHSTIEALAQFRPRVRVSGWLLLDQLHPESVGKSRVTLWEVHPIMHVEWLRTDGRWISLDSIAPTAALSRQ